MKENSIGAKIRMFRKRAGISQMELEVAIGASSGMVSRIENNTVNPTKETLIKIIDVLSLKSHEAADIFDIKVDLKRDCLKHLRKVLNSSVELEHIVQIAANLIAYELDYLGCFVTLVRKNSIFSVATTQNWASELLLKFVPQKLTELNVPLSDDSNLMVKSILGDKTYISASLSDFIVPAVDEKIAKIMTKVSGIRTGIALPLKCEDNIIGSLFVGSVCVGDFVNDIGFFEAYASEVAKAINRVQ